MALRRCRDTVGEALDAFLLQVHVACVLVVSDTEKDRLTQAAVRGPLGELHFNHDRWFHPVRALVRARRVDEWGIRPLEGLERLSHLAQALAIESPTDVSDVNEMAI